MRDHENSDIVHSDYCDGTIDDNDVCALCEARHEAELAHYRPLYEGEKIAGLHGEFTEEGLAERESRHKRMALWIALYEARKPSQPMSIDDARTMGGYDSSDFDGQGSWSGTPARFSR